TITQLNTPFNNPKSKFSNVTEVKIIDPRHPLFDRTFEVVSITGSTRCVGFAFIKYKHKVHLHIPLDVTHLIYTESPATSKLTFASINDFVELAKEYPLLCPVNQSMSGNDYQKNNSQKY
ncbi:hypothetical protein, partial [Cysteiniphilum sp. 6C5]|uniref:hypothetical protein n=1 Tax=unclassified Cysteiniphilum TaxID=2610889 RepID=UPI003F832603